MGRGLRPDRVARSVFDIDLAALRRMGITALCLDLDNTLVGWNRPPDERIRSWLAAVAELGFRVAIVSNNSAARVAAFCDELGLHGVAVAHKPRRSGFRRALEILGAEPSRAAVIGDQIWTDVWGGNRAGCFTVLVRPLERREFLGTRVARAFERLWLLLLRRIDPPASMNRPLPTDPR
ncbi:MAG: YqeG family HAD IIIA-type phosphatase [Firmicutes bacterium]|nr:YqeG family HAD IIIA-type phosphatase [Bacillota bacterium]